MKIFEHRFNPRAVQFMSQSNGESKVNPPFRTFQWAKHV